MIAELNERCHSNQKCRRWCVGGSVQDFSVVLELVAGEHQSDVCLKFHETGKVREENALQGNS